MIFAVSKIMRTALKRKITQNLVATCIMPICPKLCVILRFYSIYFKWYFFMR